MLTLYSYKKVSQTVHVMTVVVFCSRFTQIQQSTAQNSSLLQVPKLEDGGFPLSLAVHNYYRTCRNMILGLQVRASQSATKR